MKSEEKESSILDCLKKCGPRPANSARRAEKRNYAQKLSAALAVKIADALRPSFAGIVPRPDGKGQESPARTAKGTKRLDVNYSTPDLGLGLGVSIKTIGFPDAKSRRFTKNVTRVDNELRAECLDYHERQPFAVLVAVIFLPIESCDDGKPSARKTGRGTPTSFGHGIKTWRFRAGRTHPKASEQLFERIFVGLYEWTGPNAGRVGFRDVMLPRPPKYRRPEFEELLGFAEMIGEIRTTYDERNDPPFDWDESVR